jgi:hypothetical protein
MLSRAPCHHPCLGFRDPVSPCSTPWKDRLANKALEWSDTVSRLLVYRHSWSLDDVTNLIKSFLRFPLFPQRPPFVSFANRLLRWRKERAFSSSQIDNHRRFHQALYKCTCQWWAIHSASQIPDLAPEASGQSSIWPDI